MSAPIPVTQAEMIYAVNLDNRNYCGHEHHRAHLCGGHLASITSPEEDEMVAALLLKSGVLGDVWIGGTQMEEYRSNDSNNQEVDPGAGWEWADGASPWWPQWQAGQPDNEIKDSCSGRVCPTYLGQHSTLRKPDGKWVDHNGCFGDLAPKVPGVYLLPSDYDNSTKYPDCWAVEGFFGPVTMGPVWRNASTPSPAPSVQPDPDRAPSAQPVAGLTPTSSPGVMCYGECVVSGTTFTSSSFLASPNTPMSTCPSSFNAATITAGLAGIVIACTISFFLGRKSLELGQGGKKSKGKAADQEESQPVVSATKDEDLDIGKV